MRLADKKGMLVQTCQSQCPATEFVDWQVFYELRLNEADRIDYLFGRLAQTIVEALGHKFPFEDIRKWFPSFDTELRRMMEPKVVEYTPEQIQEAAAREKALMRGLFRIKKKDGK